MQYDEPHEPSLQRGLACGWPAARLWTPPWERLAELAGEASVSVMTSSTSSFRGDMLSHASETRELSVALSPSISSFSYLAQEPLWRQEGSDCALSPLLVDLPHTPPVPPGRLDSISLWLSTRETKSSLHFDPFHNLLVVVCGCKRVTLLPPSQTALLRPLALGGESSNHAGVAVPPPEAESFVFELAAGDALVIPAGWWHQVDSSGGTCAVNWWWRTTFSDLLNGREDAYLARTAMGALLHTERARALAAAVECTRLARSCQGLREAEAALRLAMGSSGRERESMLEAVLSQNSSAVVQQALLSVSRDSPTELRSLFLGSLTPLSAELFTVRMEEADESGGAADFFSSFYADVFADDGQRHTFLQRLLECKDRFARSALQTVVDGVLFGSGGEAVAYDR